MSIDDQISGMSVYGSIRIHTFSCIEALTRAAWTQVSNQVEIPVIELIDEYVCHQPKTHLQSVSNHAKESMK